MRIRSLVEKLSELSPIFCSCRAGCVGSINPWAYCIQSFLIVMAIMSPVWMIPPIVRFVEKGVRERNDKGIVLPPG